MNYDREAGSNVSSPRSWTPSPGDRIHLRLQRQRADDWGPETHDDLIYQASYNATGVSNHSTPVSLKFHPFFDRFSCFPRTLRACTHRTWIDRFPS